MGLPNTSTSRPITFLMLYIGIVALGIVSVSNINIDLYPDIDFPTVSIVTTYEGVSPEDIETLITKPIEEAVAAVEDVEEVTSSSREGLSFVMVQFKWGKEMDIASLDVREAVDFVAPFLPDDADAPFIFKFSTSAMPVLFLGVGGDYSLAELRTLSEDQIEPRLERIQGVAAVYTQGGKQREIHVYADDEKLKAYGLTLGHLVHALRAENVRVPGGRVEQGRSDFLVRTTGEFESVGEINDVVVARVEGSPVYLRDVAFVEDAFADRVEELRLGGKPGLMVMIQKQSTANTVEVSDRVKGELSRIEDLLEVEFVVVMDSAEYIKSSIGNLRSVAVQGAILAVVVLLLFLRNIPSTLIIATSIPVSVIATFIVMRFANVTLNMISMGGLALGIGMLVDSSIVVLENIFRQREKGLTRKDAAVYGASEVANAITASVLTTVAVFLPVVFVPGIAGIFFRDMAITVVFALLCSLFVALTLIPLLASKVLTVKRKVREERRSVKAGGWYEGMLRWALRHRKVTLAIAVVIFVLSVSLIRYVGVEFMPHSEPGEFQITVEMPVGTRLDVTEGAVKDVETILRRDVPEIETMFARIGQGTGFGAFFGGTGSHMGRVAFRVVGLNKRDRSDDEIRLALGPHLTQIPGAKAYFQADQFSQMMFGGARLAVEIYGHDLEVGRKLANDVERIMKGIYGATDVRVSRAEGKPESQIVIDSEKAAYYGLSVTSIAYSIQTAVMGEVAGQYREGGKEYSIRVRLPEEKRRSLEDIMNVLIPTPSGDPIPLATVASMEVTGGPVEIERKGQQRLVTVTGNLTGERDLGAVVGDLREQLEELQVPPDFVAEIAGEAEEVSKSFMWLGLALVGAVFLVYMVMASQFESLRHPFIIMFSLPLSFIGVAWMLFLTGTTLSINSLIGVIVLAGIVVNNAIILVDYTNLLRARGLELEEAVVTAARTRRRPILMTACTTILAMTPMALGLGEGSELNSPMARSVIGGLGASTILTLVIIPVVYMSFERFMERLKRRREA
ncbi:MAG: efflux RND transporter permease subunit [Candidatus Eisenbacteria bacterium]